MEDIEFRELMMNAKYSATLFNIVGSPTYLITCCYLYLNAHRGIYMRELTEAAESILNKHVSSYTIPSHIKRLEELNIVKVYAEPFYYPSQRRSGMRTKMLVNPNGIDFLYVIYAIYIATNKLMEGNFEKLQRYAEGIQRKQEIVVSGFENQSSDTLSKTKKGRAKLEAFIETDDCGDRAVTAATKIRQGVSDEWLDD